MPFRCNAGGWGRIPAHACKAVHKGVLGRWVIEPSCECQGSTVEVAHLCVAHDGPGVDHRELGAGANEEMPTHVGWPEVRASVQARSCWGLVGQLWPLAARSGLRSCP